jgi:hypothetical protein
LCSASTAQTGKFDGTIIVVAEPKAITVKSRSSISRAGALHAWSQLDSRQKMNRHRLQAGRPVTVHHVRWSHLAVKVV